MRDTVDPQVATPFRGNATNSLSESMRGRPRPNVVGSSQLRSIPLTL